MTRVVRLVAVLALVPLAACAELFGLLSGTLQAPSVTFRDVTVDGFAPGGIAATFHLDVKNPNGYALDLARFSYQLTLDGHPLVGGNAPQGFHVDANGATTLALPVQLNVASAVDSVMAFLSKDEVSYGVKTTLGFSSPVGTIDVPLEHQGTMPVPKLPDVSVAGASLGSSGMTGATLNLGIALANRNGFPLPLGALRYRVAVDGREVASASAAAPSLAPRGQQTMTLPITVDFLAAGMGIASALQSGSARVALDGGLELPGLGQSIPLHLETTVGL